jgi:hypothetical protein
VIKQLDTPPANLIVFARQAFDERLERSFRRANRTKLTGSQATQE